MTGAGATEGTSILVVDDPDILALIASVLTSVGHRVLTAADGPTALTLAREQRPAAVVLDLMLPAVGGAIVAQTLRAWYGAALPIVLMSASGQVRRTASSLGILAYLDKPFELDTLLALVTPRLPGQATEAAPVWQAAERLLAALHRQGADQAQADVGRLVAGWRVAAG